MHLHLKRAYEPATEEDGFRVLVDRLWPRGVSKERAAIDLWPKDVTPSPDLRKEWHSAPAERWADYAVQYRHELATVAAVALAELRATLAEHATVTLVYAAQDELRNHARILMEELEK